jgi:hypothetical protein
MVTAEVPVMALPFVNGRFMGFLCPLCGKESHNSDDFEQGYCGFCHDFTGPPAGVLIHGACAIALRVYDTLGMSEGEAGISRDAYRCLAWQQWLPEAQAALNAQWRFARDKDAAYIDPRFPERSCDACDRSYRGPAVYCSLACAMRDAA